MKNFLVTNDDGIDAQGVGILAEVLGEMGRVIVLAPDKACSGVSHKVTLWEPVQIIEEKGKKDWYRVHGMPADCIRIGIGQFLPEADFVFAGVNLGANLGYDTYLSGTVAAAREAAFQGKPAMAVSQYIGPNGRPYGEKAREILRKILPELMDIPLATGEFYNINLPQADPLVPAIPPWRFCYMEKTAYDFPVKKDENLYAYKADIHKRPQPAGSDVALCFSGQISVTRFAV